MGAAAADTTTVRAIGPIASEVQPSSLPWLAKLGLILYLQQEQNLLKVYGFDIFFLPSGEGSSYLIKSGIKSKYKQTFKMLEIVEED